VAGGVDPFTQAVDQTDQLTHGRLDENIDSGVRLPTGLKNPVSRASGPSRDRVTIRNFRFSQGDLSASGRKGRPPVVRQGRSLTFVNQDDPLTIRFHTVTACRAPCTKSVGIGYPLADGPFGFDSGELGFGPTIPSALYASGGGADTFPFTAAVDTPTDSENCADVPGLAKAISNGGCVGTTIFKTPKNLTPGTYAYFCRVHPFMRGAFRVVKNKKKA
jgi:plastocyanin